MVNLAAKDVTLLPTADLAESRQWQEMLLGNLPVGHTHPVPGAEQLLGGTVERAGFWRHEGGTLPYARPSSGELVLVVQGKVKIDSENGSSVTVNEGDAAFIPQGFTGSWTSLAPVLKLSVSVRPE